MTAQSEDQEKQLKAEMREIRRQIAELSTLLALKKLEQNHPALQKFAYEIDSASRALSAGRERAVNLAEQYWPGIRDNEPLRIAGRIAVLGGIAWLAAWLFGWTRR